MKIRNIDLGIRNISKKYNVTLTPKSEEVLKSETLSFWICLSDIRKAFRICYDALSYKNCALDFEMSGGVRREAPNVGSKEWIFGKNRG